MRKRHATRTHAASTPMLYRATPYQVRAFARLRLEGLTRQGYLNALIESDLRARTDLGWTPEYGSTKKLVIEKPTRRHGIPR